MNYLAAQSADTTINISTTSVSATITSAPNIIATCSYRPSTRGFVTISVTLNPTDPSYIGTEKTSDTYFVNRSSGARAG